MLTLHCISPLRLQNVGKGEAVRFVFQQCTSLQVNIGTSWIFTPIARQFSETADPLSPFISRRISPIMTDVLTSDCAVDRKFFPGALIVLLLSFALAGCPSPTPSQPPIPVEPEPRPAEPPPPEPEPAPKKIEVDEEGNPLNPSTGAPLSRVFYFDYDEAIISREDFEVLNLHSIFLQENRGKSMVLEGHCDERGTRDYNLALGERRATAVSRFLISSGAGASQIEAVSYGEERPANPSSNETAWAQNRRVEIVYQ